MAQPRAGQSHRRRGRRRRPRRRLPRLALRHQIVFSLGPSTRRLYAFDGQSNGLAPFVPASAYPAVFRAAAHPTAKLRVANIASTTYAEREVTAATRLDYWLAHHGGPVTLVDDGGEEELRDGLDADAILATMTAYTAARRAARPDVRLIALTTPPATVAWWTAGQDLERAEVNAALLVDPTTYGYDDVVDVAAIPELGDPTNVAYFADGIHYTAAAAALVAGRLGAAAL